MTSFAAACEARPAGRRPAGRRDGRRDRSGGGLAEPSPTPSHLHSSRNYKRHTDVVEKPLWIDYLSICRHPDAAGGAGGGRGPEKAPLWRTCPPGPTTEERAVQKNRKGETRQ